MRRAAFHIIAILGAGLAAGCSASTVGPTAVSHGQRSVLPDTSVPAAYTILGRQIKACWFNPADPVLPEKIDSGDSVAVFGPKTARSASKRERAVPRLWSKVGRGGVSPCRAGGSRVAAALSARSHVAHAR